VVTPLCLQVALRAPPESLASFSQELARLRAGLAPPRHVIANHRLAAEARVFGATADGELPEGPLGDFIEAWTDDAPEREVADRLWPSAEAYFERALSSSGATVPWPKRELGRVPELDVAPFLHAHDCHLGLLTMIDWVVARRTGVELPHADALVVTPQADGGASLEVSCGSELQSYRATLTGEAVSWTVITPP
jgi:hypothetical protein